MTEAGFEDVGHAGESQLAERTIDFDEIHSESPVLLIDEVAVERELADERIDLPERERHRRPTLDVFAEEAIRRRADLERGLGGVLDDGDAVLLGEGEDAEDAGARYARSPCAWIVAADGRRSRGPAVAARPRSASVVGGVRAGRSRSSMRWWPRGARRCSRSSWRVFGSMRRTCRSFHCTWTRRPIQPGGGA